MSSASTYHPDLLAPFLALSQGSSIQAEDVWIDGDNGLRAKSRTIPHKVTDVSQLPHWDFDGSSTNQAPGHDSDISLRPVAFYKDPFRGGDNIIKTMELAKDTAPWFGLEQEYTLFDLDDRPFGWPKGGFPGAGRVVARDLIEAHYRACLYAGVRISGINAEVMPSQWEFQVGPCEGISMGDELWIARYLLIRVAEQWGVKAIHAAIAKLSKRHDEHIAVYGDDNDLRLTGRHETGHISNFSSGVADRGASIRVPRHVAEKGYGYLEDRRPCFQHWVTDISRGNDYP
ncbi:glutamine synthetase [Lactarius deliciosus]|nr:glutamine synthetase [Lactarius deliciosus]